MTLIEYKGQQIDPGKINESVTFKLADKSAQSLTESTGEAVSIMPRIEAIHAGTTRNYVHYPADKLRGDPSIQSGVYSWLDPYPKPVIYNHDIHTEATGRVAHAAYAEYTQAGKPGIVVVPKITEPKAVQAIKDGRLLTVSIGASTDAAICSICGTNIVEEGFCGHMKGESYDGQVAEWIAGNIWFEELSWVNQPADSEAMVTDKESSVFTEPIEASDTEESVEKAKTPNEFYNIPNNITIVEALDKSAQPKEGGEDVKDKETKETLLDEETSKETEVEEKETVDEEETVEKEISEKEVEDDVESKKEESSEEAEDEEAKPDTEIKHDEVKESLAIDSDALIEGASIITAVSEEEHQDALAVIETLDTKVNALTKELREFYKKEIMSKIELSEGEEDSYVSRLEKRSLDSLKETLSDLEDGFIRVSKKEKTRVVQKIENPIKEKDVQEETKRTEEDTVKVFSSLFATRKK